MKNVLIIADDLTGANANCSLMKNIGLRAASFLGTNPNELPKDIEVIAATTDSRAMSKREAYEEVYNTLQLFKNLDIVLYSKRTDSTLRGNLGTELKAYQDSFEEKHLAVCVPAYPDSGRIVINDCLYVNGHLLMNTDAGKDPKMPVISNSVKDNFEKDYTGKIKQININEIEKGKTYIKNLITEYESTYDLLIFDSISNDHIKLISQALLETGIDFIAVDPGPFTKELTHIIYKSSSIATKALALIGSVTQITIDQLMELKKHYNYYQVNLNLNMLWNVNSLRREIDRCIDKACENLDQADLLIVTSTPDDINKRLNLETISKEIGISIDDISIIISRALAKIAKNIIIDNSSISGIFSTGGDTTIALAEELQSTGIEIREEVMPLAAYGRLLGGTAQGLKIVSKGGMVGDKSAMVTCVERLLQMED